ncbi:hypothetical protein F5146DRAFT_1004859 [Armillaria mellea]|nr:hypothetical protein F5146DRAFT_1004859 [Armillaria mellea]
MSDGPSIPSSDSSASSDSSLSSTKDSSWNANDVWSFYIEEGDSHVCKLCCGGDKHKKNSKDKIYSIKTGTTVKGAGIKAAERFQHENSTKFKEGPLSTDSFTVPNYSYEAFVDAIVEWIITDDQSSLGHVSIIMDLSTDLNLVNFMAVMAHWMEAVGTNVDSLTMIHLHSDLIGYHRVSGHHDGKHLAVAFLWVTDHVRITSKLPNHQLKLGWITMGNTANNGTFMTSFQCFAHIVNLACKEVISVVMALDAVLFSEHLDIVQDPISATRALVRVIHISSLWWYSFACVLKLLNVKVLQLLLDVDVCWSSTDIMIEQAILLHEVPHAFQQKLSADKTPTLSLAIPSFQKMIQLWKDLKIKFPDTSPAIQDVLNPNTKLYWFSQYTPEEEADVKLLFINILHEYHQTAAVSPTPAHSHAKSPTN